MRDPPGQARQESPSEPSGALEGPQPRVYGWPSLGATAEALYRQYVALEAQRRGIPERQLVAALELEQVYLLEPLEEEPSWHGHLRVPYEFLYVLVKNG